MTISHVGMEVPEEFSPFVAEPHLSRGVNAKITADVHVSMMFAAFILNICPYKVCLSLVTVRLKYPQIYHLCIIKIYIQK